jgi:hypothetical protein
MSTNRSAAKEFTAEHAEDFAEGAEFFLCELCAILCSLGG